ncbi:MAG: glycosyltransferase [Algoriphagus sp.]|nr:glycosyltransferase [Algoriphagus sp.]
MIRFGGFIITYNRSDILMGTIEKIFLQSFPPEHLWIIDNSEDDLTFSALIRLNDPRIKYHGMGYNAGPAGAAVRGLELCGNDGFDWIYWGDDNDPPFAQDCFERLLAIRNMNPFCGVLGAVGQFFDRKKGVIKRIQSRLLEKKKAVEVDYVAGNMSMIISGEVARAGIAPDPELFFGFEELDFCLKVKRRGFSIIVDCGLFLEARRLYSRMDFERPVYQKKNNLVREYYSLRNLLFISDSLTLNSMKRKLYVKWSAKTLYGFRYGFHYGFKNFQMIWLAFWHYWKGIKGKTLDLS